MPENGTAARGNLAAKDISRTADMSTVSVANLNSETAHYSPEQTALYALDLGLVPLPIRPDGSKSPATNKWSEYQIRLPNVRTIKRWWVKTPDAGLAIVTGKASGNLEALDFDTPNQYQLFTDTAESIGGPLWELVQRVRNGYEESTPGGVHWLYQCKEIAGNTKLAEKPVPGEKYNKVLIETRGIGGYVIVAPSSGSVHESGQPYKLIRGDLSTIPTITPVERQMLHDMARTFDQMPVTDSFDLPTATGDDDRPRPGDIFNDSDNVKLADIIGEHGWELATTAGTIEYWRRPGKRDGWSATVGAPGIGPDRLYVFTSSTAFETNRSYTKFQAYTVLNHGGDFNAAGKELYTKGFRARDDQTDTRPATEPRMEYDPVDLPALVTTFQQHLYMPDPTPLYVALGAYVGNLMGLPPLWLMLTGPPSSGKTEILGSLGLCADVYIASAIKGEAAFLSGTPKKSKAANATGGLLRQIGDFGVLILKDFTSVLSMPHESRSTVIAALREIYDGQWTRHVGTDGGKAIEWRGKMGLIAGVTKAIDSHHAVISQLGERWITYRFRFTQEQAADLAEQAIKNSAEMAAIRESLQIAVAGLVGALDLDRELADIGGEEKSLILANAQLTAMCRIAVDRDRRTGDIAMVHDMEVPARLAQQFLTLAHGLAVIGLPEERRMAIIQRVAMDSMPDHRRTVLAQLWNNRYGTPQNTREIATALQLPTSTVRRYLQDMAATRAVIDLGTDTDADASSQWNTVPHIWRIGEMVERVWVYVERAGKVDDLYQHSQAPALVERVKRVNVRNVSKNLTRFTHFTHYIGSFHDSGEHASKAISANNGSTDGAQERVKTANDSQHIECRECGGPLPLPKYRVDGICPACLEKDSDDGGMF